VPIPSRLAKSRAADFSIGQMTATQSLLTRSRRLFQPRSTFE
jgi:hypothetical protein